MDFHRFATFLAQQLSCSPSGLVQVARAPELASPVHAQYFMNPRRL